MAIGERIHFFRILRGMTQKYLGTIVGNPPARAMYDSAKEMRNQVVTIAREVFGQ